MLHWRSSLKCGSDIVHSILTHKGGLHCDYGPMQFHCPFIIQDARPEIINAP